MILPCEAVDKVDSLLGGIQCPLEYEPQSGSIPPVSAPIGPGRGVFSRRMSLKKRITSFFASGENSARPQSVEKGQQKRTTNNLDFLLLAFKGWMRKLICTR